MSGERESTVDRPPGGADPDDPVTAFIVDTDGRAWFELREFLVLARVNKPDARTIVLISPGTDPAIAESARELADEVVEGHLSDLPEAEQEALFARAGAGFPSRDAVLPAHFVRYLPLMLAKQGKIPHGPDDEVARAILDIVLPVKKAMGKDDTDVTWLAQIAIEAWNTTLLEADERANIVNTFATEMASKVDPNLVRTLFASLAGQKRRAFPGDQRWILDHDVRVMGNELRVLVCVCDAAAMHLVQPPKPAKKKKQPKELKGIEIQIATPLLAKASPDHDRMAREFGVPDPELARVLGNVVGQFLDFSQDLEQHQLNATLGAVAWNASQLKPDGTERFIQRFVEQLPEDLDPEFIASFLRMIVGERLRQYPYDHRAILMCDVAEKRDGSYELSVLRVKGGFKF